jgi:hypothetical protein
MREHVQGCEAAKISRLGLIRSCGPAWLTPRAVARRLLLFRYVDATGLTQLHAQWLHIGGPHRLDDADDDS